MSAPSPRDVRSEHDDSWRASWYDGRAFFAAWLALRRNPGLADQGGPALGFTAMAFARFGLVLLPAGIVALAGMVFNLLGRPPDAAVMELSDRIGELRQQLQAVPALAAADPVEPLSHEQAWANYSYRAGLENLPETERARFAQRIDSQWAKEQKVALWMARWAASGANDAFGALLSGLLLIVCSRLFRWWVRRKATVYLLAERAADYFLYLVTQRVLIGWGIAILGVIAVQAGSGFAISWAATVGIVLILLGTLAQLWGFWAAGKPIAALLVGAEPSKSQRRGIGSRLVLLWILQQVLAAALIGGMMLLFRLLA